MARYKLIGYLAGEKNSERELRLQRKTTKAEIEQWFTDNIKACGLDWRSGYTVKFRNSDEIYEWRWIKNDERVK